MLRGSFHAYTGLSVWWHGHVYMHTHAPPHTQAKEKKNSYSWTSGWLFSGFNVEFFQFNILSLLGINTLFLPHSTGGTETTVRVCVCVVMSEAINSSIHLVMIPWENKGHYSSDHSRITFLRYLHQISSENLRGSRPQLRNKKRVHIFPPHIYLPPWLGITGNIFTKISFLETNGSSGFFFKSCFSTVQFHASVAPNCSERLSAYISRIPVPKELYKTSVSWIN